MAGDDAAPADAKTREEVLLTLDRAWRSRARGDGQAESLFRDAIERWSTQPLALVGLGLTLRSRGDEAGARRLFARALVFAERQTGEEPRAVLADAFGSHKRAVVANDGSVALDTGRELRLLTPSGGERCRVSYSPLSSDLQFDARGDRVGLVLSNGRARVFDSYSCRALWESSHAGLSSVTHLAFADDGKTVVLATTDAIELVDVGSKTPRVRIGLPADCAVAALSAGTARRVWVGCRQGDVVLARVDPHGAPRLSRLERPSSAKPPLLAVAPRASRVVVAYASGSPFVVLDESGRVHWRAPAERSRRIGVALSADGTTLIRNACPGFERWSVKAGRWRKTRFATMANRPGSPSISPDGSFVVASCGMVGVGLGGGRSGVCRWPLREGEGSDRQRFKRYELYPRLSGVRRLVRAADDDALLVLDQTGRLRYWSPARGLLWSAPAALRGLSTAHCGGGSQGGGEEQRAFTRFSGTIAISADGERWAYGGNGRQSARWYGATGAPRVAADAHGLAFVPGTDWVATSAPLRLWSGGPGELVAEAPVDRLDESKGALLVAASARAAVARLSEGKLSVWQISPLRKVMEADISSGPPRALALSPKAAFVAARSGTGATSIWQVASGSKICTLDDKPRARALTFADDTQLLSGTAEGLTRWRAANCAKEGVIARDKRRLPSHQEAGAWNVGAAHFGQPSELLFTVGPKVATEALPDGTLRLTLAATGGRALLRAARDADGGVVLLRDGTVDLLGSDHEAAARLLRCQVGRFRFPFVACEGRLRVEGALRSFYAGHYRTAW